MTTSIQEQATYINKLLADKHLSLFETLEHDCPASGDGIIEIGKEVNVVNDLTDQLNNSGRLFKAAGAVQEAYDALISVRNSTAHPVLDAIHALEESFPYLAR